MKILQICNKMPYPPKDGGAIATLNMSKGFVANGVDLTILSMNTKKHYFDKNLIPSTLKEKIDFIIVDVPAEIKASEALKNLLFSKIPYNAERFINENFRNELIKVLKQKTFDIIQLEGLYLMPYVDTIRDFSDAKIALRSHNVEYEIWERVAENEKNLLKKNYLKILSKRIKKFEIDYINKYDILVSITQRDLNIYNKLGNSKPAVVSMTGINIDEIDRKGIEVEYPSLFHLGALDWAPNQEGIEWFLKNVWQEIAKKHSSLKFFVAGRNAPDWLIQSIKSYKNTVYLGEVDDAYKFMKSKAVMIVPLFSGSGMRIKIIEGMALGKVIISTDIGTEGIDTQNSTNIIRANNKDEFISAIEKIIEDKSLFNNISENAKEFIAQNFENKAIISNLLKAYENLVR